MADFATSDDSYGEGDFDREISEIIQWIKETYECGCEIDEFMVRKSLSILDNVINIAVVGRRKSGKSCFIKKVCGINDRKDETATFESSYCIKRPYPFALRDNPNITIWEIPALEHFNLQWTEYINFIELNKYDIFVIFSSTRSTEFDIRITVELNTQKKKFWFVRTKLDIDVGNAAIDGRDAQEVCKKIKQNIDNNLSKNNIYCRMFLISSTETDKYDFNTLVDTIFEESRNNYAFLPSKRLSRTYVIARKEILKKRIHPVAMKFSTERLIPVPGIGVAVDIETIGTEVSLYRNHLKLTDTCLRDAALLLEIPLPHLYRQLKLHHFLLEVSINGLSTIASTFHFNDELQSTMRTGLSKDVKVPLVTYAATKVLLIRVLNALCEVAVKLNRLVFLKKKFCFKKEVTVIVIGQPGTGKSSLINAIRGIDSDHKDAAQTGVVSCTHAVAEYRYENIKLVDTPAIGSKIVTKRNFMERVKLPAYDMVVICVGSAIETDDEWLLKRAMRKKRQVVIVRTKVGKDIDTLKHTRNIKDITSDIVEIQIKQIKDACKRMLPKLGVQLFVIDSKETEKYEFKKLKDYILDECYSISHTNPKKNDSPLM